MYTHIYIGENEKDKEATRQEIMQFMVSILYRIYSI